jgi:hypothetical protein
MNTYYPLFWWALGFATYHMLGTFGQARKKLYPGGEIIEVRRLKIK